MLEKVQLWDVLKSRVEGGAKKTPPSADSVAPADRQDPNAANGAAETQQDATVDTDAPADPLETLLNSSPLSHGQFQLFGLARASLLKRRSSILILDEATSTTSTARRTR